MALVNGSDYDHLDMRSVTGGDIARHMLKDAQARGDISSLESAIGNVRGSESVVSLGAASVGTYKGEVGETIVEGDSASYRKYSPINVTPGESYDLTVYQVYTNNYPHFAWAVDNNNGVIATYGGVETTAGEYSYTFTIPEGATKLLVMTNYRSISDVFQATLTKFEVVDLQSQINDIKDDIETIESEIDTAGTGNVKYNQQMALSDAEKATARNNIGAANGADIVEINAKIGTIDSGDTDVPLGTADVGTYKGEVGETIVEGTAASYRKYSPINVSPGESYELTVYQVYTNNYTHFAWAVDNNNTVIAAYGEVKTTAGEYSYTFTIPEGATKLLVMTNFRDINNVYQATLTKQTAIDLQTQIKNADAKIGLIPRYVSPSGDDGASGYYGEPFATIQHAIDSGADLIYVKAGTYAESLTAENKDIKIRPFGGSRITLQPISSVNNAVAFTKCNLDIVGLTVIGGAGYDTESPTYVVQRNNMYLIACRGKLTDCGAIGARTAGIRMDGSTLTLENCTANYNGVVTGTDGFNAHDYTDANETIYTSEITLINCTADHNGDDGVSVHEYGWLSVQGGRYTNNVTGGVTPYGQCRCEVRGAYIADNKFGIDGFQSSDATYPDGKSGILATKPTILSVGNRIENNTQYAYQAVHYNIFAVGDMLDGNAAEKIASDGTITQY